jgi:hypothetical protein
MAVRSVARQSYSLFFCDKRREEWGGPWVSQSVGRTGEWHTLTVLCFGRVGRKNRNKQEKEWGWKGERRLVDKEGSSSVPSEKTILTLPRLASYLFSSPLRSSRIDLYEASRCEVARVARTRGKEARKTTTTRKRDGDKCLWAGGYKDACRRAARVCLAPESPGTGTAVGDGSAEKRRVRTTRENASPSNGEHDKGKVRRTR